jgi:hypothetical protein
MGRERDNREGGSKGGKGGRSGGFGKTALSFPFLGPEQRREGEAALGCRPAAIAGEPGHVDGWEVGENGDGDEGDNFRPSPWVGAAQGGGSTGGGGLEVAVIGAAALGCSGRRGRGCGGARWRGAAGLYLLARGGGWRAGRSTRSSCGRRRCHFGPASDGT